MEKQSDGIWIIDSQARTTYVNDRMAEILGLSPSEIIGQDSLGYVFPEDAAHARRLFESKREGNAESFRFRLRRKDGSAVWVTVQGTPMFDDAGAFSGIVGTFAVSA
jgi:PAS domain S-box-containing protein